MTVDQTHPEVEWCRTCGTHQAMSDLGGVCPVCDPGGTQALVVEAKTAEALANVDKRTANLATPYWFRTPVAASYTPPLPVEPDDHIVRGTL